jgi:hypothetical protein
MYTPPAKQYVRLLMVRATTNLAEFAFSVIILRVHDTYTSYTCPARALALAHCTPSLHGTLATHRISPVSVCPND